MLRKLLRKFLPVPGFALRRRILRVRQQKKYPEVMSISETIEEVERGRSISRFGDGEFNLAFGESIRFQRTDKGLQMRLREILKSEIEECLVCIPRLHYNDTDWFNRYWYFNLSRLNKVLHSGYVYGNMGISRQIGLSEVMKLKKLWDNREVLFVFGEGSRFDIESELFDNVRNKSLVYGKARNAWSEYEDLLKRCKSEIKKLHHPLILISLGPTATVLAYDLAIENVQALDLGHLTNVYNRMVNNGPTPEDMELVKE